MPSQQLFITPFLNFVLQSFFDHVWFSEVGSLYYSLQYSQSSVCTEQGKRISKCLDYMQYHFSLQMEESVSTSICILTYEHHLSTIYLSSTIFRAITSFFQSESYNVYDWYSSVNYLGGHGEPALCSKLGTLSHIVVVVIIKTMLSMVSRVEHLWLVWSEPKTRINAISSHFSSSKVLCSFTLASLH